MKMFKVKVNIYSFAENNTGDINHFLSALSAEIAEFAVTTILLFIKNLVGSFFYFNNV